MASYSQGLEASASKLESLLTRDAHSCSSWGFPSRRKLVADRSVASTAVPTIAFEAGASIHGCLGISLDFRQWIAQNIEADYREHAIFKTSLILKFVSSFLCQSRTAGKPSRLEDVVLISAPRMYIKSGEGQGKRNACIL